MMGKLAVAVCGLSLALVLGGCVSPEQQRGRDQGDCASYGFQPGSDAYANCMMQTRMVRDERQREDMARWRAEQDRNWERMKNRSTMGAGPSTPRPAPSPARPAGAVRQTPAGPIFSNTQAQSRCPEVCGGRERWDGNWRTDRMSGASTCDCR